MEKGLEYEKSLDAWRQKLRAAVSSEGRTETTFEPRAAARPLIDRVTNSWRESEKAPQFAPAEDYEPGFCDLEDEDSCPNLSRRAIRTRRFRRMLAVFVLLAVAAYLAWTWYLQPGLIERWQFEEGFLAGKTNGTYGFARGGHFDGTRIKQLDPKLVPGGHADPEGKRRLIFVGDIHGCRKELLELLDNVHFNAATDHLIATGDVISKGPDSPGVLDELMRIGAESVRGNHEDRLLEAAKTLFDSDAQVQSPVATSQGYSKDHAMLKKLKHKHIEYLRDMPLMLHIPALPHGHASASKDEHHVTEEIIVVHAGLVPHVPLPRQDPYFVMNMRSIDHVTHVPSAIRETKKGHSKPWFSIWNWYNDRIARGRPAKGFHVYTYGDWLAQRVPDRWLDRAWDIVSGRERLIKAKPQVAVYGHDSHAGLQIHRWSKGLDSGCVGGGQLTAMTLDAKGRTSIVSVSCKNYRR